MFLGVRDCHGKGCPTTSKKECINKTFLKRPIGLCSSGALAKSSAKLFLLIPGVDACRFALRKRTLSRA